MANPHGDPGLQPERTTLSWGRTMLAFAVVSSLFLRWAGVFGPVAFIPAVVSLAVVVTILFTQRRRYRAQSQGLLLSRSSADLPAIMLLAGAIVVMAGTEVIALLVG